MQILTPEQAFDKLPGEVSIPIDRSMYPFQFTRNWFRNRNQCTFSTYLKPRFGDGRPVMMVQVGIFEGADLAWNFQNILTHPDSCAIAIDPWLDTGKIKQDAMDMVQERARFNLKPWENKVTIHRGYSVDVLKKLPTNTFDLVVIDGDHTRAAVLQDAIDSFHLVKTGGWLLFDDVRNKVYKKEHVVHGIDDFLQIYGEQVKLVWRHRHCDCYEKL